MADNIHPVVELLAARMESHPEEFEPDSGGRWAAWLDQLIPFITEEERVMLRGPMMQDIHEEVLDELLNGEERRAEGRRQREEAEDRYVQHQQAYLQQAYLQQAALQPGQYAQVQSLGALQSANTIRLGSETIDEGMIRKIKKALGI